ncbi:hypothetical protein [Azospirillum canadense]|uniref:hypothetical protein n=1 Tax=Azospirillum canadense TaxID=403962 RepID=UPI002225EFF1|nr:hypothetical protein [Azospirillum canadense]MCW2243169.1 hypothetical protein [Azospirillum canadense]
MYARSLLLAAAMAVWTSNVQAECVGDYPYRVCTDTYTAPNGDTHIRSYDTSGNTYTLDTQTRALPGGGTEIRSHDNQGNSYSLKSWCDSSGCTSRDSMGNSCTITKSGAIIGCK